MLQPAADLSTQLPGYLRQDGRNQGHYNRKRQRDECPLVKRKRLHPLDVFVTGAVVRKRTGFGSGQELLFVSGAMQDPLCMEVRAVDLRQYAVLHDSRPSQLGQPGDKEDKWPQRHDENHCQKYDRRYLECRQLSAIVEYLVSPV